jgi:hypothetical protein
VSKSVTEPETGDRIENSRVRLRSGGNFGRRVSFLRGRGMSPAWGGCYAQVETNLAVTDRDPNRRASSSAIDLCECCGCYAGVGERIKRNQITYVMLEVLSSSASPSTAPS